MAPAGQGGAGQRIMPGSREFQRGVGRPDALPVRGRTGAVAPGVVAGSATGDSAGFSALLLVLAQAPVSGSAGAGVEA